MRTIKELLQVMLDNQQMFAMGLCVWCDLLFADEIINITEWENLRDYIKDNPPKDRNTVLTNYYWQPNRLEPRVLWLKEHIKISLSV